MKDSAETIALVLTASFTSTSVQRDLVLGIKPSCCGHWKCDSRLTWMMYSTVRFSTLSSWKHWWILANVWIQLACRSEALGSLFLKLHIHTVQIRTGGNKMRHHAAFSSLHSLETIRSELHLMGRKIRSGQLELQPSSNYDGGGR